MLDGIITLSTAQSGAALQITHIDVQGVLRRRLLDLGFVPGAVIQVLQRSPLGDPVAFRVNNTTVALRREETDLIRGSIIGGVEE